MGPSDPYFGDSTVLYSPAVSLIVQFGVPRFVQHVERENEAHSQAVMLSVLLSILASKRVVLDRQYGRNRLVSGLGNPMDSAKWLI